MIMLSLLACSDPVLDPFSDALSDYDRGIIAAGESDWEAAIEQFQAALQDDPASPALHLWLAHSQASSGDLDAARIALDQGISHHSSHIELRYNRAAYAARAQDLEAAAKDLQYLYARELLDPVIAGEDEDFRLLGAIPRFAALAPPPQVEVSVTSSDSDILHGEEFAIEILLRSRTGKPIAVEAPPTPDGVRHLKTIEDIVGQGQGWTMRRLSVTWEACSEGEAGLGPVSFSAHRSTAQTPAMSVQVVQLPGQQPGTVSVGTDATLWVPTSVFEGKEPPWVGRLPDGRAAALMTPGMEGEIVGGGTPVQLELREHGQTVWRAIVASAPPSAEVILRRSGRDVQRERIP